MYCGKNGRTVTEAAQLVRPKRVRIFEWSPHYEDFEPWKNRFTQNLRK